jgi:5,10-methylenetetrahydromethanopterin reductase
MSSRPRIRFGIICLPASVQEAVADARLAEEVGFDLVGIADSQSVYRELYVTAALCAAATRRVHIGPCVTNPITRHPAVSASAIATLDEVSEGRAFLGIGSGDSAVLNLGERPARLAELRGYVETLRALLMSGRAQWQGRVLRLSWAARRVPVYLAAEGPRTLELAGEVADGVIVNLGLVPEIVKRAVAQVEAGARRAGRDPSSIEVWVMCRVNVCENPAAGLAEICMELASNAHHVFRFTLKGKHLPSHLEGPLRRVQASYRPEEHERIGGANAALMAQEPLLMEYLAERFAIVGPPEACAAKLRQLIQVGVCNFLFTGFVRDRRALIRALGEHVLPALE